mmetsp:Transcript_38057/g.77664  ORF Transcript_38057/g.77664 Transcript_38057/m.77664 type:complete len:257 (+) Transcript_38057:1999-2769(+)
MQGSLWSGAEVVCCLVPGRRAGVRVEMAVSAPSAHRSRTGRVGRREGTGGMMVLLGRQFVSRLGNGRDTLGVSLTRLPPTCRWNCTHDSRRSWLSARGLRLLETNLAQQRIPTEMPTRVGGPACWHRARRSWVGQRQCMEVRRQCTGVPLRCMTVWVEHLPHPILGVLMMCGDQVDPLIAIHWMNLLKLSQAWILAGGQILQVPRIRQIHLVGPLHQAEMLVAGVAPLIQVEAFGPQRPRKQMVLVTHCLVQVVLQ